MESASLTKELKGYLQITWDDEDQEIENIIKGGKAYLNSIAGTTIDYDKDLISRQLLMDYGRYVYNQSLEFFEVNFKRELLKLSIREGVKAHAAKKAETSS
ncbi:hypothetical protein [Virgibacillus salexigens]|uniref:Phage gp6-like head-tail connector protein n=1 Tax=Virgibacillus kapii TaxID=1638645 RepID=A0ABQ2DA94_9BACI|nr:hypothetical protein [Virgibacillus kapii]GGJ51025.1 hypothetical protein GCM10007111_11580 [Virgibacillus kapii]